MGSSTTTIRGPEGPGPVRLGAMARVIARIGEREAGGKNWGPVVWSVASPFISSELIAEHRPGGPRAGKLAWCAYTVCWAFLEELQARGHKQLADQWKHIASGSCDTLLGHLQLLGWAWRPTEPLPAALRPPGIMASVAPPGLPQPGDLCFYGHEIDGRPDMHHVDFFEADLGNGRRSTVGGNTGPKVDAIARMPRANGSGLAFLARVPW